MIKRVIIRITLFPVLLFIDEQVIVMKVDILITLPLIK
jgi:hypothetical protein